MNGYYLYEVKPSAIIPIMSAINPKLYEKTCYWLLITNVAKLTVHYSKYVYVWDSQVYGIQVYSILYSLQQVVTSHWPISELLHLHCWQLVCFSTNQRAITLLHRCSANQWAITLFCIIYIYKKNMLQHYLAFTALLLMGLTMDCDIVIWLQSLYKIRK